MTPGRAEGRVLVGLVLTGLIWSGIAPVSRLTWLMEVVWVLVGLPLVLWGWRRFPLTRLLCWLLVVHAFVLLYGGHVTSNPAGAILFPGTAFADPDADPLPQIAGVRLNQVMLSAVFLGIVLIGYHLESRYLSLCRELNTR